MDTKEVDDNIELDENPDHNTPNDENETCNASRDDDESSKASSVGDASGGDGDASSKESSDESKSSENNSLLVPECEMSIDPSHYGLRKELNDEDHFDALVSIMSRWEVVKNIQYYMKKSNVFDQIKESCFGCFFQLDLENWNKNFYGQIAHYMLQRRVVSSKNKELWFIIDGKPIRFGKKEFAIITGLNCGKVPTAETLYDEDEAKEFLKRVLGGKTSLTGVDLGKRLKTNIFDTDTILKLAMVLFIHSFLCARDVKRTVDLDWIRLVTNWDNFNAYPWGTISFNATVDSLKSVNLKKKAAQWKENSSMAKGYSLQGFPWAFMVWVFEAVPALGEAFGQPLTKPPFPHPRLIRWYSKKKTSPDYQTVLLTLQQKEVMVHPTLIPTVSESKSHI